MGYKVITPVASPVIPLADLRLHLRLDLLGGSTHPDDALIEGYLAAARAYCEHYTQRSVGAQTLELALDAFPDGPIELPLGAASITSITYVDESGNNQAMASNEYVLDDYSLDSWAIAVDAWPTTDDVADSVKVRYVTPSAISPVIKSAMLLIVGHHYENREESGTDKLAHIPLGVKSLLDVVRSWAI
jgi:uncharacterized phiE125 gp8 family phage protein